MKKKVEEYGNEASILIAVEKIYRTDPAGGKNHVSDTENKLEKFPQENRGKWEDIPISKKRIDESRECKLSIQIFFFKWKMIPFN